MPKPITVWAEHILQPRCADMESTTTADATFSAAFLTARQEALASLPPKAVRHQTPSARCLRALVLAALLTSTVAMPLRATAQEPGFSAENDATYTLHLASCEAYAKRDHYVATLDALTRAEAAFEESPQSSSDRRDLDWARSRAASANADFLVAKDAFRRNYRKLEASGVSVFLYDAVYKDLQSVVTRDLAPLYPRLPAAQVPPRGPLDTSREGDLSLSARP